MFKKKPYWGNHFWARGYFVNTVGINEDMIRRYVKYQEEEERKEEQDGKDLRRWNLEYSPSGYFFRPPALQVVFDSENKKDPETFLIAPGS